MRNEISIKFRMCLSKLFAFAVALTFAGQIALAQTSSFTYQGKLADSGVAANGTYDITFKLYDTLANGTQIGTDIVRDDVVVSDGGFTVDLDFGAAAFASGASRFLQLEVRAGAGAVTYTTLVPRQPLTSSPYAVKAASATSSDSLSAFCALCIIDGHILSISGGKISAGSITADKFAEAAVTQNAIRDGNVTTDKIADGAVTNGKLAAGSVDATHLTALSITSTALGDGSVLTNKISDGAVTSGKIADSSITTPKLNDVSVTTGKLADGAVTAAKIAAGVVFRWNAITGNLQAESNNGYLANSASEVTITLPTAPNIGDTIRISGTGMGGWRIAQNDGQRILVPSLAVVTRLWQSVASSADGSNLVAVVNNGQIYTSTDSGVIWTPRASNRRWLSVASSSDGSKLVAVVRGGQIYTSTDSGVTWTTLAPGTTPGTGGYLTGGQSTAIELIYIGGGQFIPLSHEGATTAN